LQLYCASYSPYFGNFYHWAFSVFDPASEQWHVFEVIQDVENGPFRPEHRPVNPQKSIRCRRPLTLLGHMDPGWWDILVQQIGTISVPGEAESWNCQDYVIEIWEVMMESGMVDHQTWYNGKETMMAFYGQDFGGGDEEGEGEYEYEDEDDQGQGAQGDGRVLSAEYVLDSSE
jgi:hypothetical protein